MPFLSSVFVCLYACMPVHVTQTVFIRINKDDSALIVNIATKRVEGQQDVQYNAAITLLLLFPVAEQTPEETKTP